MTDPHDSGAPSAWLVRHAHLVTAGMRVLGLATTYPIDKLREADAVAPSLEGLTPESAIARIS